MVRTKNTRRCILCLKTCPCFYCLRERYFFKIIRAISRQCFVYGRKLDHGGSSCSYQWWCSSQLHHHLMIYHRSSCKVSAQTLQRALQRYYDTKPNTTILKGVNPEMIVRLAVTWHKRPRRYQGWAWLLWWSRMELHAHGVSALISGYRKLRMLMAA